MWKINNPCKLDIEIRRDTGGFLNRVTAWRGRKVSSQKFFRTRFSYRSPCFFLRSLRHYAYYDRREAQASFLFLYNKGLLGAASLLIFDTCNSKMYEPSATSDGT